MKRQYSNNINNRYYLFCSKYKPTITQKSSSAITEKLRCSVG